VLSCFFYGLAWLGAIIFKRTNRNPARNILEPNSAVGAWVTEIIRGFKLGFYIEEERTIAVMSILLNFFFVPFIFLLLPAVMLQVHQYSMREVGLIELCLGIGIVISCTDYFSAFLRGKRNLYHICLLCMLVFTSAFFVFSMLSTILPLCFAGVIMGAALNSFNVIVNTRRAYCIPSAQQTMMESCFLFLCTAAIPIGFMVTGGLMNLYSLQTIMRSYAFICLFPALILYTSCSVRRMFQETVQADYYAQQYPQLFNRL
jgi:predicted MFS family arabinose efflux permease